MYNYQSEFEAAAIQSYHNDPWTESDSDEDKCDQNIGVKKVNNTHHEGGEIELQDK